MPDERSRLASLTVVGGALDGRRHDVADVVGEILIGSDSSCHLCVDLPSISPIHARIWTELGGATVRDTSAPRGIYVNSARVEAEATFGEEDALWLGPPNDPESVCIRGHFEPWQETLPVAPEQELVPQAGPAPATNAADDPFFIAIEAPAAPAGAAVPASAEPIMSALPLDEPVVAPLAPPIEVAPPALASQPEASLVGEDDFFVADVTAEEPPVVPAADAARAGARPPLPGPQPAVRPAAVGGRPAVTSQPSVPAGTRRPVTPARPAAVPPGTPTKAAGTRAAASPAAKAAPGAAPANRAAPSVPSAAPAARTAAPAARPAAPVARPAPPAVETAPAAGPERPRPAAAAPRPAHPPVPPARPVARRVGATRSGPAERRPSSRPSARRAGGGWLKVVALAVVVLGVLGALAAWQILGAVRVDRIEPARVRVGQRAVIAGRGFSSDPAANVVLFDDKRARVLAATTDRLEIEVPEAVVEAGSERSVGVRVKRGGRSSGAVAISVLQGPRLHGLSPQAAMPGEQVELAGAGLGLGASVRFGEVAAQIVQADATRIRVVVPELASGSAAPVVASVGGVESNAVPFVVGHLPVVTGVAPASGSPGDVVRISGLGFSRDPLQNEVQIGGNAALVVSASDSTLEVVVPHVGPGEAVRSVAIRVAGGANVGTATLEVPAPSEAIEARFVAEPFTAVPGRPHAVVATALGPAFVLAASGGRTAGARALEVQNRLNQAVAVLKATLGLTFEARGFGTKPLIGLSGRGDVLLEVTAEDAAAYGEDWTGLRGRGGAVTPDRLARWWEALGRDLVLLLVRGERPRHAAQLAVEGRVLGQVFDAARKASPSGVPRTVLDQRRPPLRDGLRIAALRVPATVTAPAPPPTAASSPAPARAATPAAKLLPVEGVLRGSETEEGERRYLTVTLGKSDGTIAFEGGITVTLPVAALERRGSDEVRFAVNIRGGWRYYVGRWDGQKLVGTISVDEAGKEVVASFELHR